MKKQLLVTAAIIEKDGKYLIAKRPDNKKNGGRWEFPGGKVEYGEDLRDCLKREIQEELGIDIKVGQLIGHSSIVYPQWEYHVVLMGFLCIIESGEIQLIEISDYRWIDIDEFEKFDVTENDIPLIDQLRKLKR